MSQHSGLSHPDLSGEDILVQRVGQFASILHVRGVFEVVPLERRKYSRAYGSHHRHVDRMPRRVQDSVAQSLRRVQGQGRVVALLLQWEKGRRLRRVKRVRRKEAGLLTLGVMGTARHKSWQRWEFGQATSVRMD